MMTGNHQVEDHDGALIVGEAVVAIPTGAEVPGPIYVLGGELTVNGVVTDDVIQLAGTVTIEAEGNIRSELQHVAAAVTGYPVVTFTVGVLLSLTFISIFVFMALTLVLLPVAVLGLLAGMAALAYGVIGWGQVIGTRLPIPHRRLATFVGVVAVTTGIQLAEWIPVVGDLLVAGVLLIGLGAVVVTYYGITRFQPSALPD